MRAALALVLLAACGTKSTSNQNCNQRAAAIEARIRAQAAESRMLYAIETIVGNPPLDVPLADSASADFSSGIALPIRADKPAVLEAVAAAEACSAQKAQRPIRFYFAAPPGEDATVGESAAWLAAAGKAWKVTFEARRIVSLERAQDVVPWPAHSEKAKALAKKIFGSDGKPDVVALQAEISRASRGCETIGELQASNIQKHVSQLDYELALPQGLRSCGCSVADLDELEGDWHLIAYEATNIGWIPPPEDATTRRSVSALACETARDPIIVATAEHWRDPATDIRPTLMQVLDALTTCRDKTKLDHSTVVAVVMSPRSETSTSIDIAVGADDASDVARCISDANHTYDLSQPPGGTGTVFVYLPAATTAP